MNKRISFVAGLYIMGFCALLVGGIDLYQSLEFELNSVEATMKLKDQDKKGYIDRGTNLQVVDVVYESSEGLISVPNKYISLKNLEQLIEKGSLKIHYHKNNPKRMEYSKPEVEVPWVWFITGIVIMVTAFFATKLLKEESE